MLEPSVKALKINLVEPPGIARAKLFIHYAGIKIKEIDKTNNPNYLFAYIDITASTKPGMIPLPFVDGAEKLMYHYPLKARTAKWYGF